MAQSVKSRAEKILETVARFPEHGEFALECVRNGTSFADFSKLLFDAMAGPQPAAARAAHRVEALGDWLCLQILGDLPIRGEDRSRRLREAERAGGEVAPLVSRHGVLRGLAEATVADHGNADISYRAFAGGSEFPNLVRDALSLLIVAAYEAEAKPWEAISRTLPAKDFKTQHAVRADLPALQVNTAGVPVAIGLGVDADQPFALQTYAQSVNIGRQLLINDETSALKAAAEGVAAASARTIGNAVFALLQANGALGDGVALFHTTHANTGSAALDAAGLGTTLARIRNQLSLAGERTNLVPTHILVAPGNEGPARALLGSFGPAGQDLTLIVEGRLTPTTTYYACAAGAPGLALAGLGGAPRPSIERIVQLPLGTRFLIVMDFAPVFLDFRGWARATA